MQYYNYKGMKKNTAEQSAKVVEKYRQQFAHNMEMYNYTDKGKKTMIMDLVNQMDKELAQLKNGFMVQAKAGVYDNKNKLLDFIIPEIKNITKKGDVICDLMAGTCSIAYALKDSGLRICVIDKTNDLLAFFKQVAVYEAQISMYGVNMELLQQLAQDENISMDLFDIVKAKMVAVETDDTNKANIRGIKKVDHKMDVVNNDIMDFEVLASQVNEPILPVALYGKDSMELITGEPMADYFFNGDINQE